MERLDKIIGDISRWISALMASRQKVVVGLGAQVAYVKLQKHWEVAREG